MWYVIVLVACGGPLLIAAGVYLWREHRLDKYAKENEGKADG